MTSDVQRRIDEADWYHEYDFGNGLRAQPRTPDLDGHRRVWSFIRAQLDRIDFTGKSVLEIGCWDGYWSFYAESRGAASVLATDDLTQNWAGSSGLLLAKELLGSSVDTRTDISIYDLASLGRRFDIVLCLGVYYHLVDPFYAFAQVRHVCAPDGLAVFEGDTAASLKRQAQYWHPTTSAYPVFVPSEAGLRDMLTACYFDVTSQARKVKRPRLSPRSYARIARQAVDREVRDARLPRHLNRVVTVCSAVEGECPQHHYRPPFGLDRYDPRFAPVTG